MHRIRNGQNVRWTVTEFACGTNPRNSVTCPIVDHSQLRSNGYQRIHTGYLKDAERMRTRQTTRVPDKPHTNARVTFIHRTLFIRWRPFEVLNISKTCRRIWLDKTDITWHVTHSPHGERTRNACKGTQHTETFTVRYASVTAIW